MITRRGILGTLLAAPAIIRTPGLLMPIRVLRSTRQFYWEVTWDRDIMNVSPLELPNGSSWGVGIDEQMPLNAYFQVMSSAYAALDKLKES